MALVFVEKRTAFTDSEGPRDTFDSHGFNKNIKNGNAHVVLRGFKVFFDKSANPAQLLEVGVHLVQAAGFQVRYKLHTEFKDNKTGEDRYSGHADVLIIAELEN
jgi:hypothetical protein